MEFHRTGVLLRAAPLNVRATLNRSWFGYFVIVASLLPACAYAEVSDEAITALKHQMKELQVQMQQIQEKIEAIEADKTDAAPTGAVPPVPDAKPQGAPAATADTPPPAPAATAQPWTPSQPITLMRSGGAYMNISFNGLMDVGWSTDSDVRALEPGDHDPAVRGFTIPNAEIALDGAVDPYFKGFSNIVFKLDSQGNTGVELEEMYFLTSSLPWNLQLKGGQFFAEFGRQNPQHPHAWAFVDQPLVLNRMFGPEGLRSQGARLSWLAPTPWFTELTLGVFNSNGETAFSFDNPDSSEIHGGIPDDRSVHGLQDLLYVPRISTSFDLTDTQTLVLGASAAFGPNNSGNNADSQVYGTDLYWKWKAPNAQEGFPFVSFQSEALYRRYQADQRLSVDDPTLTLPEQKLDDWGIYSQVLWGIQPRWVAGLRGEFASGAGAQADSELREDRTRVSPNLTWYPSEFSKVRLQYNFDHRQGMGDDSSVWLQFGFLLGSHSAHKF